jgi:hypothetical protein
MRSAETWACDVGLGAAGLGVALEHGGAQGLHRLGRLDVVAGGLHGAQRAVQALEHRQIGRGADRAGVGREAVEHHRHPPLRPRRAAQAPRAAVRSASRSIRSGQGAMARGRAPARQRRAQPVQAVGAEAAAEDHRVRRAVDLGQRDHHRRLDRGQPAVRGCPLVQRLELQRMRGDVGHVERGQRLLRRGASL